MDVTFIMVHGQDTVMTTMMLMDQCKFFIDEYERINKIEKKLGMENQLFRNYQYLEGSFKNGCSHE